ncbi:hypothetical protein DCO56_05060 [Sphingobacterium athyrii]|uniref:Uncharacterized protein n=1 Tax=Sphingobacterium athyrii TaxID=2152717 RepID=A0A363NZT1_9SPHI|nr:hypothetical protein DCO56_05060 [Sphingobacterium athyrii]
MEEIMQEIFVQLFLKRNSIPSAEAIFPFLFLVAKRTAITLFRKELSRQKYQVSQLAEWDELNAPGLLLSSSQFSGETRQLNPYLSFSHPQTLSCPPPDVSAAR